MLELTKKYFSLLNSNPEFFGIQKYCNICGYRFSKFSIFNNREARCPLCGSLERHRHVYIYIQSIYPFLNSKKILHFAPENILKKEFINSGADYYDADIDPKKATYQVDITDIQFKENTFDYIFCIHVLEHIPDDLKAMKELYRVLKIGGTAFLCVPLSKSFNEQNYTDNQTMSDVTAF